MNLLKLIPKFLALPSFAATLIGNYPQSIPNENLAAVNNNVSNGFILPAGIAYTLYSVTIEMLVYSTFTSVHLDLYGGTATGPTGASLVSLVDPGLVAGANSDPPKAYTFTPVSLFTLQPSTNYWLVLDGAGSDAAAVYWSGSLPGVTPSGIATFLGTNAVSRPPDWISTFQVDGTPAVPEPATAALLVAGAALLWVRRGRFNRTGRPSTALCTPAIRSPCAVKSQRVDSCAAGYEW